MLGTVLVALGGQLGASLLLLIGMVTLNRRLQRCGTGLLVLLTAGLIGLAVAEHQTLLPDLPPGSRHWFK